MLIAAVFQEYEVMRRRRGLVLGITLVCKYSKVRRKESKKEKNN
jgi:hypothetical protein